MAVEGIGVVAGVHVAIADTAEDFKKLIRDFIFDKKAQQKMGANARAFVKQYYQKEIIYQDLVAGFKSLLMMGS
jgi:hypothetical protein